MLKQFLKTIKERLQKRYRMMISRWRNQNAIRKWHKSGNPLPAPHEYRQETIKQFAERHNADTFIETGTHDGRMVEALRDYFSKIYTIELNIDRYLNVKERFYALDHVSVIKGESSVQLPEILNEIDKPAIFWLDTHAWLESGLNELSVLKEIDVILGSGIDHVILINDVRLFIGEKEYPSIIDIRNRISAIRPDYHFEAENDVIRAFKPITENTAA